MTEMEQFNLEENLKDFGIKIKPGTELFDHSDYYDDEDSDEQELVYSYARPSRSSYASASAALPSTSASSSRQLLDGSRTSNLSSFSKSSAAGGSRKRKQELSAIERDGSFPEEMTFQEYEAEIGGRLNGIGGGNESALSMYSKRKDKPPLYLLNPDDFQHDPMKQYQIRRAIITYRHHQEKKELIRQLKDENSKLRSVVDNFKKREDLMLKYCNCQRIMEIIVSSNPEDILQLPPPAPKPLPSIPPLPKGRMTKQQFQQQLLLMGGNRPSPDDDDEVLQDDFGPEEMLTSFTATMVEDTEDSSTSQKVGKPESRRASTSSNNSGKMPISSLAAKGINSEFGGRNSEQGKLHIKPEKANGSSIAASQEPEFKRKNVGPLTISQIQKIFSMHKEKQQRMQVMQAQEQQTRPNRSLSDSSGTVDSKQGIKSLQGIKLPTVEPLIRSSPGGRFLGLSSTSQVTPKSTSVITKVSQNTTMKSKRMEILNSKLKQVGSPGGITRVQAAPNSQTVNSVTPTIPTTKKVVGNEKVKSAVIPTRIKIKEEPAEMHEETSEPSNGADSVPDVAVSLTAPIKEEKPVKTSIPATYNQSALPENNTKPVKTYVTSAGKVRSQSKSPEKKVAVEVKIEPVEAEGNNQRRSKRTSAIFRPNAADMLKGIIRKVGTRPDIKLEDEDLSPSRSNKNARLKS